MASLPKTYRLADFVHAIAVLAILPVVRLGITLDDEGLKRARIALGPFFDRDP